MPACSGRVLFKNGSKAVDIKVEGKCSTGMTKTRTRSDGSFDLATSNTTGRFDKLFVDGDLVDRDVNGGGHIYYLTR